MVWGNLATGYWLGGAAAAGLHWVELARKTLTGTSDTLDVTAGWSTAANSGSVTVDGNITVTATGSSQTPSAWYDLGSAASTTGWVLRFKVVFDNATNANSGQAEGFQVGLFDSNNFTAENPYSSVDGAFVKSAFHAADSSADHSLQTWDSNSTNTGAETGLSEPYSATRYFELKRDGTTMSLKVYSDEYSTQVGSTATDTITASNFTDLQYINVRIYRQGISATNTYVLSDMKFWNNTTSTSGTPTHEFNSTSGFTSGFTAKPYMMVLQHGIASGSISSRLRFNSDTGSNYAQRGSRNGASDSTGTSRTNVSFSLNPGNASDEFLIAMVNNTADQEKTWVSHGIDGTGGAGNDPNHSEVVGKWANTSDSITSVNVYHSETGDYASGSECVVLGCDPDDTEGTSVWEELASGESDGSSQTFTTGTFTPKKYLWFQAFNIGGGTTADVWLRFNDDAGANYVRTFHSNGGANDVALNQSNGISNVVLSGTSGNAFCNGFIINKSDEEKFMIVDQIVNSSTGAGNVPNIRYESFNKWTNTSSQINKISIVSQSSNFSSGCYIKVWGFD